MPKKILLILVGLVLFVIAGCAPQPEPAEVCITHYTYGWFGLRKPVQSSCAPSVEALVEPAPAEGDHSQENTAGDITVSGDCNVVVNGGQGNTPGQITCTKTIVQVIPTNPPTDVPTATTTPLPTITPTTPPPTATAQPAPEIEVWCDAAGRHIIVTNMTTPKQWVVVQSGENANTYQLGYKQEGETTFSADIPEMRAGEYRIWAAVAQDSEDAYTARDAGELTIDRVFYFATCAPLFIPSPTPTPQCFVCEGMPINLDGHSSLTLQHGEEEIQISIFDWEVKILSGDYAGQMMEIEYADNCWYYSYEGERVLAIPRLPYSSNYQYVTIYPVQPGDRLSWTH